MKQHVPADPVATPAGNRAKVFVLYSRKDLAFAQTLVGALAARGFDAFLDKTDIAPGEPWKERLARLIATADTIVFAVSPDLVASTICAWELEESARLGKRVIPIVVRRIGDVLLRLGRSSQSKLDRRHSSAKDRTLYCLFYATRNPAGIEVFRDC